MKDKKLKILVFDIESGAGVNGFKSDLAVSLCIGYKWSGEKRARCLSILDYGDLKRKKVNDWDKEMLKEFASIMSEADVLVGHYSSRFDRQFLSGRLLIHGLPPLPPIRHIDTCIEARKIAKFSSNRLGHLAKILKSKNQKSNKNWPEAWNEVTRFPEKHVKGMIPYCKKDVMATDEVFIRLRPHMKYVGFRQLEKIGISCPKCGSTKAQRRGRYITSSHKYQRFQCKDCGGWFRDSHPYDSPKPITRDL